MTSEGSKGANRKDDFKRNCEENSGERGGSVQEARQPSSGSRGEAVPTVAQKVFIELGAMGMSHVLGGHDRTRGPAGVKSLGGGGGPL